MGMNIKNPKTHKVVRELAKLTGETQTEAITKAVIERLERVKKARGGSLAERLLAIGKDSAPRFKEPYRSMDHGDLLYDEDGLPK
jgi:antitoxin VapB